MAKVILIADTAYPLTYKSANQWRKNPDWVIAPLSSDSRVNFTGKPQTETIPWNRKSSLSALSAVRMAEAKNGKIDTAVVVFDPSLKKETISLSNLEKLLDSHIKAFLLLFRELTEVFSQNSKGTLIPVLYRKENNLSEYETIAASTFYATIDQMIENKNLNFIIKAIDSGSLSFDKIQLLIENTIKDSKKKSHWIKPDTKNNFRAFITGKRI